MISVDFWNTFGKERDSTTQPSTDSPAKTTLECLLKDSTSILHPVLKLRVAGSPTTLNYAYIADFHRYYWVDDWTFGNDGCWYCSLSVDVLATYKGFILQDEEYISRTSHPSYIDNNLPDNVYPITTDIFESDLELSSVFVSNPVDGSFVLGVIANGQQTFGAATYYIMSQQALLLLIGQMMGNLDWTGYTTQDIATSVLECFFNPFQYIVSCKYIPIKYASLPGTDVVTIKYGVWEFSSISAKVINPSTCILPSLTYTGQLPRHPQIESTGFNWLNASPYSNYRVFYPPFGNIQLDAKWFINNPAFKLIFHVDLISGNCMLQIQNNNSTKMELSANISVDVPLAQMPVDFTSAFGNMMPFTNTSSLANSAIQTAGMTVSKFLGGVANSFGAEVSTDVSILEGGGNLGALTATPVLGAYFRKITTPAGKYIGSPCCKILTIGNLLQDNKETFVQCSTSHIKAGWAYTEEQEQLEQYLLNGFYLE